MCCYSFTYSYHFDFRKKMGFTCIFENDGEKSRKNWLENEFCILHLREYRVKISTAKIIARPFLPHPRVFQTMCRGTLSVGLIDILYYNGKFTCHGAGSGNVFKVCSLVTHICRTNVKDFSLCSSVYWPP